MNFLKTALRYLDEYAEYILIVLFYSYFLFVVGLEVILRYGFSSSTIIGEETARHAFIWLSWIAASFAVRKRLHLSIAFYEQKLSRSGQYAINLFYNALFILLCIYGIKYVFPLIEAQYEYGTLSRAARYPMFVIYLSVPLGYGLMVVRVVQNIVIDYLDMRAGQPIRRGQAMF